MKNKTKKFSIGILAMLMMVSISCEDILKVDPRQSIDFELALDTRDGMAAGVNAVYARLRSARLYGRDLIMIPEALADNGRATNNSGRLIGEFNNNVGAHFSTLTWRDAYFTINDANLVIEAIPELNDPLATQADKDYWMGSMKFIRALMHFELVRIYAYDPGVSIPANDKGGVPIIIKATRTVDAALNLKPARSPVADVYTQIYADLDDALAKIPVSSTNRYFANLGAVHALYARVALYNKDYSKVITEVTAALSSGIGALTSGAAYVKGWKDPLNPESLFEVRFQNADENIGVNESLQTTCTSIRDLAILGIQGPSPTGQVCTVGGWGDLVPTASLNSAFQLSITGPDCQTRAIVRGGTDDRAFLYEVGNGRNAGNQIECIKYLGKSGLVNLDNAPILRVAELYLSRAEAYMSQAVPDETLATADLNTLLAARNLPATALTGTALYDEILNQRRLELAFEGHRWFDLKRRGVDIVKLPATVLYTDFRILPPLPQSELDGNPNLVQNVGY